MAGHDRRNTQEVNRETKISRPLRISQLPIGLCVAFAPHLCVHGKGPSAFEPEAICRTLVENEECLAIACSTVTQVGAYAQRARCQSSFAGGEPEIVEFPARKTRQADDEVRRTMTELQQFLGVFPFRAVKLREPVDLACLQHRRAANGGDNTVLPLLPGLSTSGCRPWMRAPPVATKPCTASR